MAKEDIVNTIIDEIAGDAEPNQQEDDALESIIDIVTSPEATKRATGEIDLPARSQIMETIGRIQESQLTPRQRVERDVFRKHMKEIRKIADKKDTGADWLLRLGYAWPKGEGKINFLNKMLGESNVLRDEDGTLFVRKNKDQDWRYFDKPGTGGRIRTALAHLAGVAALPFGGPAAYIAASGAVSPELAGDYADVSRDAFVAIPGAAVGALSGGLATPFMAAGADALAEGVAQGIGALMPGEEPDVTMGDRALDTGIAGVSGLAMEGALRGAGRLSGVVGPRALKRQALLGEMTPAMKAEADALAKETGMVFTPGAIMKDPDVLSLEGFLRQVPGVGKIWRKHDLRNINALSKHANGRLDKFLGAKIGAEDAARQADEALTALEKDIKIKRSEAFRQNMAEAQAAVLGRKALDTSVVLPVLKEWATANPGDKELVEAVAREVNRIEKTYGKNGMRMSPLELQGEMARLNTKGTIFAKGNEGLEALIRRDVKQAYMASIKEAERAGGGVGVAATKLRHARKTYADMSRPLDDFDGLLVKKLFKLNETDQLAKLPEMLVTGTTYTNTNIKKLMAMLDKQSPLAAQRLRRAAAEELMVRSAPGPATLAGAAGEPIHSGFLATWLGNRNTVDKLDALMAGAPGAREAITKIQKAAAMDWLSRSRGAGSQTHPLQMFTRIFDIIKSAPLQPGQAMVAFSAHAMKRRTAIAMTSPDAQVAITRLLDAPPTVGKKFVDRWLGRLGVAIARGEMVSPNAEEEAQ